VALRAARVSRRSGEQQRDDDGDEGGERHGAPRTRVRGLMEPVRRADASRILPLPTTAGGTLARPVHALASILAVASVAAVAAPAVAAPTAQSAAACRIAGQERKLGPTYVTRLTVRNTTCARGKDVVRAYYRCRVDNGGRKGRCTRAVLGYRCTERRQSIATQFDAQVVCRKGRATIRHNYTQFT